ncbi:hypothetical protein AVEN_275467-1 [Araneus ventricosus]|uniref:Uncharacterized protein n=1 Tax=Araneus ventricosus TaxID=182803 RepID=A0A4Y2LBI5_ARAVE|nr:hypothetical protein AVEN_275467-1 [Araneus ventricosus]
MTATALARVLSPSSYSRDPTPPVGVRTLTGTGARNPAITVLATRSENLLTYPVASHIHVFVVLPGGSSRWIKNDVGFPTQQFNSHLHSQ